MKFISTKEEDNKEIAKEIIETCKTRRIFAFYGNLGAGKTHLVKEFCHVLGTFDSVTSPTFALVNEYLLPPGSIFHFDFYRIESETEAYDMGCDEYFNSGNYCFIEWPEKIPTLLPLDLVEIHIEVRSDLVREITVIIAE